MWPTFYIPSLARGVGTFTRYAPERCGASITFDLDQDFPGIRADDYVVYYIRVSNGAGTPTFASTHEPLILQPSGVESIWWEPKYGNHKQATVTNDPANSMNGAIYGGFVTDTTADMTFTRADPAYEICGFAVAYRGVSKRRPVSYMASVSARVNGNRLPYGAVAIQQSFAHPAVKAHGSSDIWVFRSISGARSLADAYVPVGDYIGSRNLDAFPTEYSAYDSIIAPASNHAYWCAWTETAALSEMPTNLIPWSRSTSPTYGSTGLATTGWTLSSMTVSTQTRGSGWETQTLSANSTTAEHLMYCDVSLESGKTYFLTAQFLADSSPACRLGLSISGPTAAEEGYVFSGTGNPAVSVTLAIGTPANDPIMQVQEMGGIPDTGAQVVGFPYTATETGTHRVRVLLYSTGNARSWAGGAVLAVAGLQLTEGRVGVCQPSSESAGWRRWVSCGTHESDVVDADYGYASIGFTINKSTDTFQPVQLENWWAEQMPEANLSPVFNDFDNKLVINAGKYIGFPGNATSGVVADQWVFPTYRTSESGSPVTGKYYAEITVDNIAGGSSVRVMQTSSKKYQGESQTSGVDFAYASPGTATVPNGETAVGTPATFTTGDVIGVAIDYETERVTFYKNGVSQFYCAMPAAWADYGGMPLRLALTLSRSGSTLTGYTVNLTGPFTYKPSGFVAYDVFNDAS